MNYYILLTVPLVWMIVYRWATEYEHKPSSMRVTAVTIAIYLALLGIILGVR